MPGRRKRFHGFARQCKPRFSDGCRASSIFISALTCWLLFWPVGEARAQACVGTVPPFSTVPTNQTCINSGALTNTSTLLGENIGLQDLGSLTVTNTSSGTISGTGFSGNGILAYNNATVTNSGIITGGDAAIAALNAIVTNSGSISGGSYGVYADNTSTVINSGSIVAGGYGIYGFNNATVTNSGTVSGAIVGVYGFNKVTVTNSGTVSGEIAGIFVFRGSGSTIVNSGTIVGIGGTAINFNASSADSLNFLPGSKVVGSILLGTADGITMSAGNQNLTVTPNGSFSVTGNVPYVTTGNRIASVDPTPFGIADKNLMAFTGAVWGLLGSRGNAADAGGESGALGFAGSADTSSYVEDAFAQVMGYTKAPSDAVFFKNPTMTTSDGTTVWAKGFYGQRTQEADGPNLRNVTQFFGGAIGLDRMVSPDLRLGGFAGGGSTSTVIDLTAGTARSDIGFGGIYGRKDIGTVFVDFALLGGGMSSQTTRNINNNLAPNGFETATGSFGGWFMSPELAVGKRYAIDAMWSVTPTARIRYLTAGLDGYTETGSTANLTVASRTLQNVEERGDLTLTRTQTFANADRFSASIYAGLLGQQRLGDSGINTILLGQALAFATPGKSSIGGVYAGGGVEWQAANHLSMFASAEYAAMTDSSNTVTGKAGLRYGF